MSLWLNATTYYIDPSGNNSNAGTSPGTAWLTLTYACAHATTPGDTIHIDAGTYVETKECVLALGVSIIGEGQTNTIIKSHYAPTGNQDIAYRSSITLASPSEGTDGYNQSLSNFRLDGDNLTGTFGITVWRRKNVIIHDMTIIDFYGEGICLCGFSSISIGTRATGIQFYNNNVTNCGDEADINYSQSGGSLRLIGLHGVLIHDNIFTHNTRTIGHCGDIIEGNWACEGTHIYNNKFYKRDSDGASWNFMIEFHNCSGGCEINNNEFYGSDCIIDMGADPLTGGNSKGSYNYSYYVHNNLFTSADGSSCPAVGGQKSVIDIEGTYNYDIWVYFNHIKSLPRFILCDNGTGSDYSVNNLYFCYNILENMGYSSTDWTDGLNVFQNDRAGSTLSNVYYYNNVMLGNGITYEPGIYLNNVGTTTNFNIKNNIFENCSNGGFVRVENSGSINGFHIDNDIIYNNSSNTPTLSGNTISNYSFSNYYTSNPLFVSSTDFHLQSGSPGINAGVNVGLTLDYEGNTVSNPPEIGAYEYILKSGTTVDKPTGNPEVVVDNKSFIIYPNPVKDKLTIAFKDKDKQVSLKLYDSKGMKLYEGIVTGNTILDMSSYASGLYILHIGSAGELKVVKIIK